MGAAHASAGADSNAVTSADRDYMRHALELARRGLGKTYPNPAVGCVIVKDGKVRQKPYMNPRRSGCCL